MTDSRFGDLMRERREAKGWSQRHFAEVLHQAGLRLDPSAISRIESDGRDVKLSEALTISRLLGFQLSEESLAMQAFSAVAGNLTCPECSARIHVIALSGQPMSGGVE